MAYTEAERAADMRWRGRNPEKIKEQIRRRQEDGRQVIAGRKAKMGVDGETQKRIFAAQGGHCAVCGVELDFRTACLDHDHSTGAVREFLCRGHNTAIGLVGDSPTIADRMAAYLRKHGR